MGTKPDSTMEGIEEMEKAAHAEIARRFREMVSAFKGDSDAYARGYRQGMKDARRVVDEVAAKKGE